MGFFDRFKRKHELVQRAAPKDKAPKLDEQKAPEPEMKKESSKASKAPKEYPLYREGGSVLLKPVVSEKSTRGAALGQYVFVVHTRATKGTVKVAFMAAYGVRPISVNIQNYEGKKVRFGRHFGVTKSYKKAIVTLPKGKSIDVLATEAKS